MTPTKFVSDNIHDHCDRSLAFQNGCVSGDVGGTAKVRRKVQSRGDRQKEVVQLSQLQSRSKIEIDGRYKELANRTVQRTFEE